MLTDLSIKKQPLPEKRRELADGKITGLYLVLQPSGAKSWALRYRAAGKPAKLTLGPYPTLDLANARKRAQEALGEIASGKNPAADKKVVREAQRAADSTADRVEAVAIRLSRDTSNGTSELPGRARPNGCCASEIIPRSAASG